jgi:hypothetical protein
MNKETHFRKMQVLVKVNGRPISTRNVQFVYCDRDVMQMATLFGRSTLEDVDNEYLVIFAS